MSSDWVEARLETLIDVKHGYAFEGAGIRDEPPGDILLTPGNFAIGGGFKGDKFKYFDGTVPEAYVLNEGELVVTMTDLSKQADTLGYPALVPSTRGPRFLHNQRLGKVAIKQGAQLDSGFLFYLLRTAEYRREVLASATGTTVKHTSPSRILAYKAAIPPLGEQKVIASILGALDDKIELNRRMNSTLEAMARALFQSWFVDFDPVRAKLDGRPPVGMDAETAALFPDAFEESAIGLAPRGWSVARLSDAVHVNPRRSLKAGAQAAYLDMKNLPTQGHCAIDIARREFRSGSKFQNGDTLLARITPCLENGKTGLVDFLNDGEVAWGSTEYIVLAPKRALPPQYVYLLARSDALRAHAIQNMTGTSGRQRVPAECFDSFLVAIPPDGIARKFHDITGPMFVRTRSALAESRSLASLRETLLPKLLSGEVPLDEAVGECGP